MNSENQNVKPDSFQSESDPAFITGKQAVSLITITGEVLAYSGITRDEARLLIDMQSEWKDEFETFVHEFLKRVRLNIAECTTLPHGNGQITLQELCDVCNLITTKPVRGGEYSDPTRHLPGGDYYLAAFQKDTGKSMLSSLLKSQGYRPATLRETLLILRSDPHLLDRYPILRVFGSGSSYGANLVPEIRRGRNGSRQLKFKQGTLAQSSAYHSILAKE